MVEQIIQGQQLPPIVRSLTICYFYINIYHRPVCLIDYLNLIQETQWSGWKLYI